jgi:hypothetical protein
VWDNAVKTVRKAIVTIGKEAVLEMRRKILASGEKVGVSLDYAWHGVFQASDGHLYCTALFNDRWWVVGAD